ncbi:MAG: SdrD B-like domain-containing protein [Saprospiraceae bacterium]
MAAECICLVICSQEPTSRHSQLQQGYSFTYLDEGADDTADSDANQTNGMTINEVLVSGEYNDTYDAGMINTANTKIGDFVWEDVNGNGIQDAGEPGLEDVTVQLTGNTGNGTPVDLTTTTDGSGMYMFGNLFPGTYKLTFTTPTGYSFTYLDEGADDTADSDANQTNGMTINEVLESGEYNDTYDAGMINTANTKIGDFVWEDVNGNGIQDAGEPGLEDVTVQLTGNTGNGTPIDLTTTTDGSGMYMFGNLFPGTYKLTFTTPTGYSFTYLDEGADDTVDSDANQTNGMTINEVLVSGEYNDTYDAGMINTANTKIGDFVWEDTNGNGIQDAGEPGIEDVTVRLTGTTGNGTAVDLTTTTDGSGMYMFGNLFPGTYKTTFITPVGYTNSYQNEGGNDALDSDPDADPFSPNYGMTATTVLVSGQYYQDFDAGYYQPATLGNFVWEDLNGNGLQDGGEPGVGNITVTLDGTTGNGAVVNRTTTTNASGIYFFDGLVPGSYKVTFDLPTGYSFTYTDEGADDTVDSDADQANGMTINEIITSGENYPDFDAGIINTANTKIGDFVWDDTNGNGIQDAGEPGIEDVTVRLTGTTGNGTPVDLTTTTDGSGMYMFGNLFPGTYKTTFITPVGYTNSYQNQGADDTIDSDPESDPFSPNYGMTATTVLISGQYYQDFDAGYYQPATLGNFVWEDLNGNGLQDGGEPGVGNITVTLDGTTGNGTIVNRTTTTNASGIYFFDGLVPGSYKVTFDLPTGYSFTYTDEGADDTVDSDADQANGMTINEIITSGENYPDFDAGIITANTKIGDFVWEDVNGNGIRMQENQAWKM